MRRESLKKIADEGQIREPGQQVVEILWQRVGLSPSKHPGTFIIRALPSVSMSSGHEDWMQPKKRGEIAQGLSVVISFLLQSCNPKSLEDIREAPDLTETQRASLNEY